jgi:hypothetical protein
MEGGVEFFLPMIAVITACSVFAFFRYRSADIDQKVIEIPSAPPLPETARSVDFEPVGKYPVAKISWQRVGEEIVRRENAHEESCVKEFESLLAREIDKSFYTKVAGSTHRNKDGTSRKPIIAKCHVGEILELIHEPDNPVDPNAIRVCRKDGSQLGYLEDRLAGEIVRDVRQHGPRWAIMFAHHNRHPETDKVVGATLYIVRMTVV